jgi:hypothetical protein
VGLDLGLNHSYSTQGMAHPRCWARSQNLTTQGIFVVRPNCYQPTLPDSHQELHRWSLSALWRDICDHKGARTGQVEFQVLRYGGTVVTTRIRNPTFPDTTVTNTYLGPVLQQHRPPGPRPTLQNHTSLQRLLLLHSQRDLFIFATLTIFQKQTPICTGSQEGKA